MLLATCQVCWGWVGAKGEDQYQGGPTSGQGEPTSEEGDLTSEQGNQPVSKGNQNQLVSREK